MRLNAASRPSVFFLALVSLGASSLVVGCGGDDAGSASTPGATGGKAGSAAAGAAGSSAGTGGKAAAGAGGGTAGNAGSASVAGSGGAAGSSAGSAGAAGGGAAGASGAGAAGAAGTAGAAGSTAGCAGDPTLGLVCSTKLKGACDVGHNKCIQGVISCVPDFGPGEKPETCNGIDDDCDGVIDNGLTVKTFFKDDDKDGFGSTATTSGCQAPDGYVAQSGDCNDNNAAVNPQAPEICNDADDNCNGVPDEGVQKPTWYKDNDGDLYGGQTVKAACTKPAGFVEEAGDCNDFNKDIYAGAPEQCNNADDDCNGLTDDKVVEIKQYKDNDGDGWAPLGALEQSVCKIETGWTLAKDADGDGVNDWDCDDAATTVFPKAPELCDTKDNNCDGLVDAQCSATCAGKWPLTGLKMGYHMPVRLIDLDGDNIEEILFVDYNGKLTSVGPQGQGTEKIVCPSLSFNAGYDAKFGFVTEPKLGTWGYVLQFGTRLFNLDTCTELFPRSNDVSGFGSVGDFDGDHALDFVGHGAINTNICFKLSTKGYATECIVSPTNKPYDGHVVTFDIGKTGVSQALTIRGRTYPEIDNPFDGSVDVFSFDGAKMVLSKSIDAATTKYIGAHIMGPTIADFDNDGYGAVRSLFGGRLIDIGAGTGSDLKSEGAIPVPTLFDVDADGKLDGVASGALVDFDSDGVPESIFVRDNNQLTVRSNRDKTELPGWPLEIGATTWSVMPTVGDADNDKALEAYVPSQDGVLYCTKFGTNTAGRTNVVSRGEPEWFNRTLAKDEFEPNGGYALAWPLHFPTKEIRAYLTKGDEDFYKVQNIGGMSIQLSSPRGVDYDVYLENEDGSKVFASATNGGAGAQETINVCVGCTPGQVPGDHYTIRVVPKDKAKDFSNTRPYVLRIGKSS